VQSLNALEESKQEEEEPDTLPFDEALKLLTELPSPDLKENKKRAESAKITKQQ
jgi:hypothetical protein